MRMESLPMVLRMSLIALVGCAAPPAPVGPAPEPIYCQGADQCSVYWRRAQVWIVQNSHWKIQTANDALIQTFNSIGARVERSYTVTRLPVGGGREQILISSGCANMIRCVPASHGQVEASFNSFVRAQ